MTVRHFDGTDDVITTSIGGLSGQDGGPITIATIWRPSASAQAGGILHARTAGGAPTFNVNPFTDGITYYGLEDGGGAKFTTLSTYTANEWYLLGVTKADGSALARAHRFVYSTDTWTHVAGGTFADAATNIPAATVTFGRNAAASQFLNGDLAVVAVWNSVLSDGALEGLTDSLQQWIDADPDALWAFNQASVATPIEDLSGGGANQTAITGTTVVTGDDPPGFTTTGGSGGTRDANTETLQALARANFDKDLNGALREASGLARDANGIARSLTGKDFNASYDELVALLS